MNIKVPETVNFKELVKINNTFSFNIRDKLVEKLNYTFQDEEQRWYAANLYMYMNYHPTDDFPINLEDIYSMIGFVKKGNAKQTIENNFILNTDYKIYEGEEAIPASANTEAAFPVVKRNLGGAGQNKETVRLNIDTFKNLCMIARTEKGKQIRTYYLKLESIFNGMIKETMDELLELTTSKIRSKEDKIIDQFPEDKMCIYIADIGVIDGLHLVKFGETNNLKQRMASHRNTFENFELISAYEVFNSRKFEKMLKEVPEIKYRLKHAVIKEQNRNEIMFVDERYTIEDLNKEIKNMIEKYCTLESCLADVELCKAQEKTKQDEIELKKIQEKTKQDEVELKKIQEKTKQMEIDLEIKKLELRTNSESLSETMTTTSIQNEDIFTSWLRENIIYSRNSRLGLCQILEKYDPNITRNTKTYFKKSIEKYIKDNFEYVKPNCRSVKIDGKDSYGWLDIGFDI